MPPNLINALAQLRLGRQQLPLQYGKLGLNALELGQLGPLREATAAQRTAQVGQLDANTLLLGQQLIDAQRQAEALQGGQGAGANILRMGGTPPASVLATEAAQAVPPGAPSVASIQVPGGADLPISPELALIGGGTALTSTATATGNLQDLQVAAQKRIFDAVIEAVEIGVQPIGPDGNVKDLKTILKETADKQAEIQEFKQSTGQARVDALEARIALQQQNLEFIRSRAGVNVRAERRAALREITQLILDVRETPDFETLSTKAVMDLIRPLNALIIEAYTDPELARSLLLQGVPQTGYTAEDISFFGGAFGETPSIAIPEAGEVPDVRQEKVVPGTPGETLDEKVKRLQEELKALEAR